MPQYRPGILLITIICVKKAFVHSAVKRLDSDIRDSHRLELIN